MKAVEFKQVSRKPIFLNKNIVAVLHIFTRLDNFEDLWMTYTKDYDQKNYECHIEAAKEFISQFNGHLTPLFVESLALECLEEMRRHDKSFGTKFADKLKEKIKNA